ncbi:hypothetical protein ABVK25_010749 [Lepraria finkii]|uniref:Uncharacterized protein n=1 Tax=Lepraria finkii TaxID=1340010 RepID=A0ABR4ATG5_9LECA
MGIIAQSCSNPYCVCTLPPAAPVVESFPDDYTITSAVFFYATSTGAADPCAYTEDPGMGSWIYLVSKTKSTCGPSSIMPPQGGAPPPTSTATSTPSSTTASIPSPTTTATTQPQMCQITSTSIYSCGVQDKTTLTPLANMRPSKQVSNGRRKLPD